MQRRSYLALAGSVLGAGLAGCSGTPGLGTTDRPNSSPTDSSTGTPTRTAVPPVASDTFEGTGSQTTDQITTERPAVFVSADHRGSGYFAIVLRDGRGEQVSRLVTTRGQFDGRVARNLEPGAYYLDVSADGQWHAEVERSAPLQRGSTPSVSRSHTGPWVFGPYQSSGAIQVQFEGSSRNHYAVWKLADDASRDDRLFEEDGPTGRLLAQFSGDSVFFLAVESYGAWDVTIEKP